MSIVNKVVLVGRLGADPELRQTKNGNPVMRMRIATAERVPDGDKGFKEHTEWHTIIVWGKRAEGLARLLHKGEKIVVEGHIRSGEYTDKDGVVQKSFEIHSDDVEFAGGGKGGEKQQGGGGKGSDEQDGGAWWAQT